MSKNTSKDLRKKKNPSEIEQLDVNNDFEATRIVERINILGNISDDDNCLSRFIGTKSHRIARTTLKTWMLQSGMDVSIDNVGNVRGIIHSKRANAKHFVIGSHYDTVFDAGKYDGPLGILLGIEVADRVSRTGTELPFHLNIVAFSDEEGGRFNTTFFGSSALAGKFNSEWLNIVDDEERKVSTILKENGFDISKICDDSISESEWLGYYEPHIEQGPVLCDENLSACLVTSIAAQTRINVKWSGTNGHAGTCPMHLRNDALCAAAELILIVEGKGRKNKNELVATVGKLNVEPNSSNVIPGTVQHSIDLRSSNENFLENVASDIWTVAKEISERRQVACDWKVMQSNPATICDDELSQVLGKCIKKKLGSLISIPSGAGHDGIMISKVAPVCMLFIRCKEGISHNPEEYASFEDIKVALDISHDFIRNLDETYRNEV